MSGWEVSAPRVSREIFERHRRGGFGSTSGAHNANGWTVCAFRKAGDCPESVLDGRVGRLPFLCAFSARSARKNGKCAAVHPSDASKTGPALHRVGILKMLKCVGPLESREAGGRMIVYHGWADSIVNPYKTVEWYEQAAEMAGDEETLAANVALFMVPGLDHCDILPGPGSFTAASRDPMTPQEARLNDGVAPTSILAKYTTAATPPRVLALGGPRVASKVVLSRNDDSPEKGSGVCLLEPPIVSRPDRITPRRGSLPCGRVPLPSPTRRRSGWHRTPVPRPASGPRQTPDRP